MRDPNEKHLAPHQREGKFQNRVTKMKNITTLHINNLNKKAKNIYMTLWGLAYDKN